MSRSLTDLQSTFQDSDQPRNERNYAFARWLEARVKPDFSNHELQHLPRSAFLWSLEINDPETWVLPWREGAGSIGADGTWSQVGAISLDVIRSISSVMSEARTNGISPPPEIRKKIHSMMRRYRVGGFMKDDGRNEPVGMNLTEQSIGQLRGASLNKEDRRVTNVSVLRETSTNRAFKESTGRRYSQRAREQVANMINGAKAFVDHGEDGVRSVKDVLGFYENGHMEDGIVKADLRYLPNQAEWFEPIVENMSDKVGLSIHAFGDMVFHKDTKHEVVEDISALQSADLVSSPGSTINLFESTPAEGATDDDQEVEEGMDLTKLTLAELAEARPDLVKSVTEAHDAEGSKKADADALREKLAKLEEDNKALRVKIDEHEVADKVRDRDAAIAKLVKESKLPEEAVTDTFMESLRTAKDDEARAALVDDRKKLVAGGGVKGMGDSKDALEESDEKKRTAKDVKSDYAAALTA